MRHNKASASIMICCISIMGCTSIVTAQEEAQMSETNLNLGWRNNTYSKPDNFIDQVGNVQIGSSRQQVIDQLGSFDLALSPIDMQPICDSYGYIRDGQQLFVHVRYKSGQVIKVIADANSPCAVI